MKLEQAYKEASSQLASEKRSLLPSSLWRAGLCQLRLHVLGCLVDAASLAWHQVDRELMFDQPGGSQAFPAGKVSLPSLLLLVLRCMLACKRKHKSRKNQSSATMLSLACFPLSHKLGSLSHSDKAPWSSLYTVKLSEEKLLLAPSEFYNRIQAPLNQTPLRLPPKVFNTL